MSHEPLEVDPLRTPLEEGYFTGIYVRALGLDGNIGTYDILELTRESLLRWLDADNDPQRVLHVVQILLGHDPGEGLTSPERKDAQARPM